VSTTADLTPYRPSQEQVAALLRARTKDDLGKELGEWTTATRPTLDEVENLIGLAQGEVTGRIGVNLPPTAVSSVQTATALLTACYIEKSYYPEATNRDTSAYVQYREEYERAITGLLNAMGGPTGFGPTDEPGGTDEWMSVTTPPAWHLLYADTYPWQEVPDDAA
jgi:hypothetical protein